MGSVKKILAEKKLIEREAHHSRLFIDLAENIHIHHREFRTVFSLDEYFEYARIVENSTNDVRNYLEQNEDYREGKYPTTLMIAGGKTRQLAPLKNSPKPNKSYYYNNDFAIELQDEYVTDEIHIHYRDFRIALDRKRFREIAEGFKEAIKKLDEFESENEYLRESHPDRFEYIDSDYKDVMGVKKIKMKKIHSNWYHDILNDWSPDALYISKLRKRIRAGDTISPILLTTEKDGTHKIFDGHHRFYAYLKEGFKSCDCIVTNLQFDETEELRNAEVLLKTFDQKTNYKYALSSYLKKYYAYRLNTYYKGAFKASMISQRIWYRAIRKIARTILGKKYIFKYFFERHNHHN